MNIRRLRQYSIEELENAIRFKKTIERSSEIMQYSIEELENALRFKKATESALKIMQSWPEWKRNTLSNSLKGIVNE